MPIGSCETSRYWEGTTHTDGLAAKQWKADSLCNNDSSLISALASFFIKEDFKDIINYGELYKHGQHLHGKVHTDEEFIYMSILFNYKYDSLLYSKARN